MYVILISKTSNRWLLSYNIYQVTLPFKIVHKRIHEKHKSDFVIGFVTCGVARVLALSGQSKLKAALIVH
jgi:hypothetical protein